jgi:hypothetical protein
VALLSVVLNVHNVCVRKKTIIVSFLSIRAMEKKEGEEKHKETVGHPSKLVQVCNLGQHFLPSHCHKLQTCGSKGGVALPAPTHRMTRSHPMSYFPGLNATPLLRNLKGSRAICNILFFIQ